MNRSKMSILSCILIAVLTTVVLRTGVARATSLNCGTWSIVPSPNPGPGLNYLNGVTRVPGTSGQIGAVGTANYQTLTEFYC